MNPEEIQKSDKLKLSVKGRRPRPASKSRAKKLPPKPFKKTTSPWEKYKTLVVVNVVFLALVTIVLWRVSVREVQQLVELPTPPDIEAITSTSSPSRLIIPSIQVDSAVQLVGKTKGGKMAVPNNFTDVGWYKLGFFPGTEGNAVIAGHLDDGKGAPAVFGSLNKLEIGDHVYVVNKKGQKLDFLVTGMSLYDYDNAPLESIFGTSSKAHLNLITCDGVWDATKKVYDKRLIVFTDFVGLEEGASP